MSFAVVMPVGPGDLELARTADTLDSLHHFEPDVARVVLVDDFASAGRDLRAAAGPLCDRVTVVENPRRRDADGWSEGVLVGVATGLREVVEGPEPPAWILKLDTDALICGRFGGAVERVLADDPTIGVVGTYLHDPAGRLRDMDRPGKPIRKLMAPLSIWRQQRTVKTSLVGVGRERRALLREAVDHGYRPALHCQGGAYGVSIRAVRGLADRGLLDTRLWQGTRVPEDVVMGAQIYAIGMRLAGLSGPGEPFAIEYIGLPDTPERLVADGRAIVHSLKDTENQQEDDVRARFRNLRGVPAAGAAS